jgi:hypothetical protein
MCRVHTNDLIQATLRDETLPATQDQWMEDMQLMHHYSSDVSLQPMMVKDRVGYLVCRLNRELRITTYD